jgi:hypothetical protein
MEHLRGHTWRYWLVPADGGERRSISLPVERIVIGIDFVKHEYSTSALPDGFCCSVTQFVAGPTASHAVEDCFASAWWRREPVETVNGYRAVRFDFDKVSLWLAPALGCAQVKRQKIDRNWIGIPTNIETMDVTKFEFGQPDAALFAVPANFRHRN